MQWVSVWLHRPVGHEPVFMMPLAVWSWGVA
jgi:hypothetical protein